MWILRFLTLMCTSPIKNTNFIKNIEYPLCKNCKYFSKGPATYDTLGKCMKFGEKNIVSGEITYEYADMVRSYINKCGIEGKYYEKRKNWFEIFKE